MSLILKGLTRRKVLIAVALLYLTAGLYVWMRLSRPSDGTRLWLHPQDVFPSPITAIPLNPHGSKLLATDRVVAVEGQPVQYWGDALFQFRSIHPTWTFGQRVVYTVIRDGQRLNIPVILEAYPLSQILGDNLLTVVFLLAIQVGAGWLFVHRPNEHAAQTLLLSSSSLTAFSICWFLGTDLALFVSANGVWLYYRLLTFVELMVMCAAFLHFTLLLLRLQTQVQLKRSIIWSIYLIPYPSYVIFLAVAYTPRTLEWLRRWEHGIWALMVACLVTGLLAVGMCYRRLENMLAKRRVVTIIVAYILTAILAVGAGWVPMWLSRETDSSWQTMPLVMLPIALSLIIAILFYRLFDFRFIIQRTLVWSALTATIIAVYITIVGTLSIVFNRQNDPIFSLLATGVSAMLFHPLLMRLQRVVNKLVYGERDAPYNVIISLTKRLEAALVPEDALRLIVRTISEALKLPYAAIELIQDEHNVLMAEFGSPLSIPAQEWLSFPLKYAGETVGHLIVAPHMSGETLTLQDHRLISGLVHEAEVTIQTARLTVDLQRSREKLVAAREEERRRIRRDLHDGLGPNLASLMLQIDATRNLLEQDIPKADGLLVELKTQIQSAVSDIRRLAYELRPPTLDELGFVAALKEKARQLEQSAEILVTVDACPLPPLSAAVEDALYRITLEALTNTIRHAGATKCSVRLTVNGDLCLEICDNGHGLPDKLHYGIGIHSMQERAAELGGKCVVENTSQGGTCVVTRLPMRLLSPPQS